MDDDLELAGVDASNLVRRAWSIAEKSAADGVVAESELAEFHRLAKAIFNLPDDYEIDIS